jgi:hypothetical protein
VKKATEINAEVRGNLALYHFVTNTAGEKCINEVFHRPSKLTPVLENGTFDFMMMHQSASSGSIL